MNETMLSGLLDQYSERRVTMLDEKLRLSTRGRSRGRGDRSGKESDQYGDSTASESRDGDSSPEDERQLRTAEVRSSPPPDLA